MNQSEQLAIEEEQLRDEIRQLTDEQKRRYYRSERQRVKDPDTYAALNWMFVAGAHHFYLGKWGRGAFNLAVMLLGLILLFSDVTRLFGYGLVALVFIVELPQLFNSQNVVKHYNNQVMRNSLAEARRP